MRAAQVQLDIVSRNVSNANTEGYTRKEAPLQTLVGDTSAYGVMTGEVRRSASISLAKSASGVTSSVSRSRWRRDRCLVVSTMLGCRLHRRATWQGSGVV
jgi:flagellar hook-associated protein 1 FlgK